MKRYIKASSTLGSLNGQLWQISTSAINGGDATKLNTALHKLLVEVPIGNYILSLGNRGYSTGYIKESNTSIKWLYDGSSHNIDGYWDIGEHFIVLPAQFNPSDRVNYDDDVVVTYELISGDKVYEGMVDYDPMKDERWHWVEELGAYYYLDYINHFAYVQWKL